MRIKSYQQDLLADQERLAAFNEAINEKAKGVVYDLGSGTGVFASLAASKAKKVYAIEKDALTAALARKNLANFENISLLITDVKDVHFQEKADIIICEMLDTALIDEEQVPILNFVRKFLKETGEFIPCGVFNGVEAVSLDFTHICYQEGKKPSHQIISPLIIYDKIYFKEYIEERVNFSLPISVNRDGMASGIKISTFTLLTPDLICGPTPMLNPPILIPTNHMKVIKGDKIILNLSYSMGGGLNTIRAEFGRISEK
jgi:predicted RNA methylase